MGSISRYKIRMPLYLLTLFYPSLTAHQNAVREVRAEVEAIAGKNWLVLSAGEQICAIGFAINAKPETLSPRFSRFGSEKFHFLLTEVAAVRAGFLSQGGIEWLARHVPRGSPKET